MKLIIYIINSLKCNLNNSEIQILLNKSKEIGLLLVIKNEQNNNNNNEINKLNNMD